MKMKEWNINRSTVNDCKGIAEFITIVWNETYKGIINDKFLVGLKESENQRYLNAEKNFDENNNMQYIIKNDEEKIIGFLKLAKTDNHEIIEMQSLYLLKDYQKQGIGKKLFEKALEEARKMGYKKMKVGCLEKNPSNEFYLKMGGKFIAKRKFELPNETLYENVYEYQLQIYKHSDFCRTN